MQNDGRTKKSETEILARLRRRPDSNGRPNAARSFDFLDGLDELEPDAPNRAATDETSDGETANVETPIAAPSDDAANRAAALKRLVDSNATKSSTSALSSLSSTLRNLREELVSTVPAAPAADASLDLIESEIDAVRDRELGKGGEKGTRRADSSANRRGEPVPSPTPTSRAASTVKTASTRSNASNVRIDVVSPEPERESFAGFAASNVQNSPVSGSERTSSVVAANREKAASVDASDLIVVSQLKKGYVKAKKLIPVLQGVDLTARQGELLAIVGQSGSGKSTLLHLMGTLDVPDSGTIHFDGQRVDNLPSAQRDVLRNRFIGMIFQFYHLIPEMTTLENVLAPLMIRESIFGYLRNRSKYVARAKELLALVGLSHRLKHRPNELSGGEMQRASIARALIAEPRVLLADEPTGNLDSKASIEILKLLRKLNQEQNLTVVMVTHDPTQAADADRAIRIVDGRVVPE